MTDDELRRQIAEILTPKPWPHAKTYVGRGCGNTWGSSEWFPGSRWTGHRCGRCGEPVYNELGCPEPPKLTDPWPVLAERLTRKCRSAFSLAQHISAERGLCGPSRAAVLGWWLDLTAKYQCELLVEALERKEKP